LTTIRRSCSRVSRKCLGYLAQSDAEGGGRVLVGSGSAAVSHRELTTALTTTMTTVGPSPHPHLHDNRTRIVPGRTIGLCLQIRRLGVRIPSGALPTSGNWLACCQAPATLSRIVTTPAKLRAPSARAFGCECRDVRPTIRVVGCRAERAGAARAGRKKKGARPTPQRGGAGRAGGGRFPGLQKADALACNDCALQAAVILRSARAVRASPMVRPHEPEPRGRNIR
jgi:hypothetical protein